ncbi:MAG: polymorphic toxin-type HINT domain-containing protein [Isosphaeraceae bacterium]
MLATLLLGASVISAAPERPAPSSDDLKAYQEALVKVGNDADEHVKLALWCERHGLSGERVKHLAIAILTKPSHVAARGLMGMVDFRGRWERPDAVAAKVKADEELAAKLAEYNRLRDETRPNADGHAKLAQWCEANGLEPEAKAHLTSVVRLDPSRDSAWRKLGMKRVDGRWVDPVKLAEEQANARAQRAANREWKPVLTRLRKELRSKNAESALEQIDAIEDPRALPSVWSVFATGDAKDQEIAVRILGRMDGPAANRALAALGVYGDSPEVRRTATETLLRRDGRDFIGLLIGLVREPVRYEVRPSSNPNLPGELFIDGERAITRRVYFSERTLNNALSRVPRRLFDNSVPFNPATDLTAIRILMERVGNPTGRVSVVDEAMIRDADIARDLNRIQSSVAEGRRRLAVDVQSIETNNAGIRQLNDRALGVLVPVAGVNVGEKPDNWNSWWADQRGYVYEPRATPATKPIVTQNLEPTLPDPVVTRSSGRTHSACFAAGTPVRTLEGLKAIETIQVGDRVLSQDVTTGALRYTAVLVPVRNKPSATFRLKVGDDEVVATAIHRFWKAGRGWVKPRDLKPGDTLRTVGGLATVGSIQSEGVQEVFNLEVAEGQTYFVGASSLLVHDHTPVLPVARPFDAPVTLAEIGKPSAAE